jgi:hypothetical protein
MPADYQLAAKPSLRTDVERVAKPINSLLRVVHRYSIVQMSLQVGGAFFTVSIVNSALLAPDVER